MPRPLATLALCSLFLGAVPADDNYYPEALEAYNTALEKFSGGDWAGSPEEDFATGLALMKSVLERCKRAGDAALRCRVLLHFGIAYAYEERSAALVGLQLPLQDRVELLEKAVENYLQILLLDEKHEATLQNLYDVAHRLGSAFERRGEYGLAESLYSEMLNRYAIAGREDDATSWQRHLLAAYRDNPRARARGARLALAAELAGVDVSDPELGAEVYATQMHIFHEDEPETARAALVAWTSARVERGDLDVEALDSIPSSWSTAPPAQLRAFVTSLAGEGAPPQLDLSWWLAAPERRELIARAARTTGALASLDGDANRALRAWELGVAAASADSETGRRLRADLAEAYAIEPERFEVVRRRDNAGPYFQQEYQFQGVEQLLEAEASPSILARSFVWLTGWARGAKLEPVAERDVPDLLAQRRYHLWLGFRFRREGRLTPEDLTTGAVYQLERALEIGARVEQSTGLTVVNGFAAQSLASTLEEIGQAEDAVYAYLLAGQSYLDEDALDDATAALADARRLATGHGLSSPASLDAMEALAALRVGLLQDPAQFLETSEDEPIFSGLRAARVRRAFVIRQEFKSRADLASAAAAVAHESAPLLSLAALRLALDSRTSLIGPADEARLGQVVDTWGRSQGLTPVPLGPSRSEPEPDAHFARLSLSEEDGLLFLVLDSALSDALSKASAAR